MLFRSNDPEYHALRILYRIWERQGYPIKLQRISLRVDAGNICKFQPLGLLNDLSIIQHRWIVGQHRLVATLSSATRKQVSEWQAKYTFLDTSIRSGKVNKLYDDNLDGTKSLDKLATKVAADLSDPLFAPPRNNLSGPATDV